MRVAASSNKVKAVYDDTVRNDTFTLTVPDGSIEINIYQTHDVIKCLKNFYEYMRKTGQIRGDLK